MNRIKKLLDSMYGRLFTPGDIVASAGLPRYEVLAALHILEELGVIELVIAKGNYRVYKLSKLGEKLYKALEAGQGLALSVEVAESEGDKVSETSTEVTAPSPLVAEST
jgi:DNA-binding transcriptional ArsR family regulator